MGQKFLRICPGSAFYSRYENLYQLQAQNNVQSHLIICCQAVVMLRIY